MSCDLVLEDLLDAEPSELSPDGLTPLGRHLSGCARCRRLAAQLMRDTRLLAVAMESASARRPARRASHVSRAPVLVVGALAFAVVLRVRSTDAPASAPVVADSPPVGPIAIAAPASKPAPRRSRSEAAPSVSRTVARAFPQPVPVMPVRLEQTRRMARAETEVVSGEVTVDPPPGTRAAVLHTSNPKLVVVWLY